LKFKIFIEGEILAPPKRPDNWIGFMEGKIKLGIEKLLKVNVVKMNVRVRIAEPKPKTLIEVFDENGTLDDMPANIINFDSMRRAK